MSRILNKSGFFINLYPKKDEKRFAEAVRTAVINKRAGGCGLISGRKTFQRPLEEGIKLFHLIQDVYLSSDITIA